MIATQQPKPVKLEQSFQDHHPVAKIQVGKTLSPEITFDFEGVGFVVRGRTANPNSASDYIGKAEVYIDGKLVETAGLPADFTTRRYELCWKYQLPMQKHTIRIRLLNPTDQNPVFVEDVIVYSNQPSQETR